ncbi:MULTISPECIES: DAK2 domain-containing protein [Bacillus]|uniref:DAK2 domain-containing protein n=1 Tax=Bacillus cereus TaxID=1396 RepID=A0ABD7DSY4_BACCE|nr:DAK2 domain-containing protein [Bacillus cereus]KAB5652090.1 DAK2 domain-containing protein [Bacillus thuringiensis]KAA6481394.1 DAK2 domain-containing protein [Bacillus cereus]KAB2392991.1 DAK2 domain-containing protein [Bacillus cereus]KAB2414392.1 DAK2 domain-containing protein [Bacillus cereus]
MPFFRNCIASSCIKSRAGTVGERSLGYPDAGAHALGVIFTEIAGSLK